MKRQSCDSFRQNADTGIHGSHLHNGSLSHCFAGSRATHEKGIVVFHHAVLRFVPGLEQSRKYITLLQNEQKKTPAHMNRCFESSIVSIYNSESVQFKDVSDLNCKNF